MRLCRTFITTLIVFSSFVGIGQDAVGFLEKSLEEHHLNGPSIEWQVTRKHVSRTSKIQHIYYQQLFEGVRIKGTESSIHISSHGNVLLENNQFVARISEFTGQKKQQRISPKEALEIVIANSGYHPTEEPEMVPALDQNENKFIFSGAGISEYEIPVVMSYVKNENQSYHLVWEVTVLELDDQRFMLYQVDVQTGQIVKRENLMISCLTDDLLPNEAIHDYNLYLPDQSNATVSSVELGECEECYEVIAIPFASPYDGDRTIVENPADPIASPLGWHDTDGEPGVDSRVTLGNNTSVSEEGDNRGHRAFGGKQLDFTGFSFHPIFSEENQSEDAAITNVFYWNNLVHDITYYHGFDEASNNFQIQNYYVSGPKNDDLGTRIQAIPICNAFFVSADEGRRGPITILGICDNRDASFDSTVIIHEYGHAIVESLIGDSSFCLKNDEQMTEGWADYLGVLLTMSEDDLSEDRRPIANFFFGQGPNGRGVRRYPYSTDFSQNPQTYAAIEKSSVPHGVGSVWGSMLWEMTWALIDRYGFDPNLYKSTGDIQQDAGNIMALTIVIEAMKLTRCDPGFVDARDAILLASEQIYGPDNQCTIFNAFAKRGLGLYAQQGSSEFIDDGFENFETMPTTAQIDEITTQCYVEGINTGLTGGLPRGGVYSGVGVIDDGNGTSFSLDTSISGSGPLLLRYEIEESYCTTASIAEREIDVILDETPPEIYCPVDMEVTIPFGESYVLPNFRSENLAADFCTQQLILAQEPLEYTELPKGKYPITMTATDVAGNSTDCTFLLEVNWTEGPKPPLATSILLYPVPVKDALTVYNLSKTTIRSIYVQDIHGRVIQSIPISSKALRLTIPMTQIAAGTYFITIEGVQETIVKKVIRI